MYGKKNLMLYLAVFVFTAGNLFAQNSASTPVNLSIQKSLSIVSVDGNLNFGTILQGAATVAPIAPEAGAHFLVNGSEQRLISLTFSPLTLTGSFGGNLTFSPEVRETQNFSTYSSGTPNLVNSGSAINTAPDGTLNIWVGGSIDNDPTTPEGDYTGSFTISVAY